MRKWKTVLFILLGIALVALSFFMGSLIGFQKGFSAAGMTSSTAELWLFHDHLTRQMANADCEGLKNTLNDFLAILDKYKDVEGALVSSKTVYYGDNMFTHGRLALIERKLGNEAAAQEHIKAALEFCAKQDWKECSADKIFSTIKRIDQKNPMACLSDE